MTDMSQTNNKWGILAIINMRSAKEPFVAYMLKFRVKFLLEELLSQIHHLGLEE